MPILEFQHVSKVYHNSTKALDDLSFSVEEGEFLSKTELRKRGGLSSTLVEKLDEMGILGNMPEDNQLSLFDDFF